MHVHPENEITVVLEGVEDVFFDDMSVRYRPGDVWVARPGEVHGTAWNGELSGACVGFTSEFLGDALLGERNWFDVFTRPPTARPWITGHRQRTLTVEIGRMIQRECTAQKVGWEEAVRLHVLEVLLVLVRDWRPDASMEVGGPSSQYAKVRPALELVFAASRAHRKIKLEEAARACAMSRSLFCQTFRQATGVSFGQFELRSRLSVASYLLRTTSLSVSQVAERTGFAGTNHLDARFRAEYGLSPTQARLLERGNAR